MVGKVVSGCVDFLVTVSDGMIIWMVDWICNIVWLIVLLVGYMAMVCDWLMSCFLSGWNGCLLGWLVG